MLVPIKYLIIIFFLLLSCSKEEKKISVIYLAGSHYRETSKKIELNQINNKYQSKEFFLFVGSRDKYKNFKLLSFIKLIVSSIMYLPIPV